MAVTTNLLLTGPPRSGKTTVVERVRDRLAAAEFDLGGVYCPELRSEGKRVGFEIVDVATGESRILAHVDRESGPTVGTYRVNVAGVDEICAVAFDRAFAECDVLLVDEIAPMELYKEAFVRQVRRGLDAPSPLFAVVHGDGGSREEFVEEVGAREDVERVEVTAETRDDLPETLAARIRGVGRSATSE